MTTRAPRRLKHARVAPWRSDWLTTQALAQGLQGAVGQALAALSRPDGQGLRVLDLGCGERPWAHLFGHAHCVGIDLGTQGARPDVIARAEALPFADGVFDLVFSSQVLEHVPRVAPALAECARVLRSGGRLVLSVPFYWPLHEEPHDYTRFTSHGLRRSLAEAGFDQVAVEPDCGSLTMVCTAALELLPRRHGLWLAWAPLVLVVNLAARAAQAFSRDRRSPLNWVVMARAGRATAPAPTGEPR